SWLGVNLRRIITTKESMRVGVCIYCGATQGKLTDEHISSHALNGRLVLLAASCERCAKVTSALERVVLRNMFFAARAALGMKTRRPKERLKPQPMLVRKNGIIQTIMAPLEDHWKVIRLPIFPVPAWVDGRQYDHGIEQISMDQFELSERGEDIAKKHGVEEVVHPQYEPEDFARWIAKMALGYAIERYGLNAFDEIYIRSAILGMTNDIGQWVGCSNKRELPVRKESTISVAFRIMPGDISFVKIKMFAQFDGAEYVVIVGKVKALYANWIRAKWTDG